MRGLDRAHTHKRTHKCRQQYHRSLYLRKTHHNALPTNALKFRSSFFSTKYSSLGENLPLMRFILAKSAKHISYYSLEKI